MLQGMRKIAKSWVASIFLGALALSFAVWGIADIFRGNADNTAVTVGDIHVSSDELQQEYRNAIRQQTQQTGVQITPEQARAMGLGTSTLNQIISRNALDTVVQRLGLTSSDAAVTQTVRGMQVFAGPLGTFDHDQFVRVITQSGFTEQSFIDTVRTDTARDQLVTAAESGFVLPTGYVRALFAFLNEVRAAEYIVVPANAVGQIATPSDAMLQSYVSKNVDRYSTPEYRSLVYASITPQDVMNRVSVTDAQLHQEYDSHKATYVIPEKRELEQISFPNEADAKAARAKIDAGTSFEDLAKSRGLKLQDISLGALAQADLDKDRGTAVFALPANGVTQPVKSAFGWVLVRVTKITPGSSKSFDDVKATIKADLMNQLAANKLIDITNAYTDAYSSGASLEEAAKKVGMRVHNVPAVDHAGLAADGSKADVPATAEFMDQVFAAEVGDEGDPFATKDGNYYVLKVAGTTPPKLKPLDTVRAQATAEWTAGEQARLLTAKANALVAQANKDNSLAGAAKAANTTIQRSGPLQRRAANATLSPEVIAGLFASPVGRAVDGPGPKGTYIIARTTGVVHPPLINNDPQFIQGAASLAKQVSPDITVLMANAARAQAGVTINQANVDRVIGGGSE
ncbi:MAG TPA: SurA N-terminal domain-containing protein [Rhizomicrobium sp.]|jgi:peptidyl-prolyl cis-trans isomerase D|nr:SurA N-terminal domain-containing protein [Rhizomicrobium sp.]